MLQQDKVDLTFLEGTLLLEKSGQSSHNGTSLSDLLLGEETEVSEFGDEDSRLGLERLESLELLNNGTIYWSAYFQMQYGKLTPPWPQRRATER